MARPASNVEMTSAKISKDTLAMIRKIQDNSFDNPTISQVIARLAYAELERSTAEAIVTQG